MSIERFNRVVSIKTHYKVIVFKPGELDTFEVAIGAQTPGADAGNLIVNYG